MPILWGYECRPLGGAVCVPSQPQRGCEVIGDNCQNHYMGGDLTDDTTPPDSETAERIEEARRIQFLYVTGQICRLE